MKLALITDGNGTRGMGHVYQTITLRPGRSFFEALLLVGTPVLCFHQNSFQQDAWRGQIQTYGKEDVSSLGDLLQERRFTLPDDPKVLAMEIGEGIGEIVSEIVA